MDSDQAALEVGISPAVPKSSQRRRSGEILPSATSDSVQTTGWLLKHSKGPFGHRWSQRYFELHNNRLTCSRTPPSAAGKQQGSGKDLPLDPFCRVEDMGRIIANGKELFTFKVHFNARKPCLLGTMNPEVSAKWVAAIQLKISSESSTGSSATEKEKARTAPSSAAKLGSSQQLSLSDSEPEVLDAMMPRSKSYGRMDTEMDGDMASDDEEQSRGDFPGRMASVGSGPPSEFGDIFETFEHLKATPIPVVKGESPVGGEWKLVRLENGLRYFEEVAQDSMSPDFPSHTQKGALWCRAGVPCVSSVGSVKASSDAVFRLVMDLDPALRRQWDPVFSHASLLLTEDGHTDCIRYVTRSLPSCPGQSFSASAALPVRPREIIARRYWHRDHDGTYLVLFQSADVPAAASQPNSPARHGDPHDPSDPFLEPNSDCSGPRIAVPSRKSVGDSTTPVTPAGNAGHCRVTDLSLGTPVRASLTYGGFIISPALETGQETSSGPCSVVTHILELNPGGLYDWWPLRCLGVTGDPMALQMHMLSRVAGIREYFSQSKSSRSLQQSLNPPAASPMNAPELRTPTSMARRTSRKVPTGVPTGESSGDSLMSTQGNIAANAWQWAVSLGTLGRGPGRGGRNCWSEAAGHLFPVRSLTYLADKVKMPARPPLLRLAAVDWLKSSTEGGRIDHVVEWGEDLGQSARRITPIQAAREKFADSAPEKRPFFFVVNMQVPGAVPYSMIFYWVCQGMPSPDSLLGRFCGDWEGAEGFRNARFKLIPRIAQGAWVVKRSVGTTPLIIPGTLKVNYFKGPDYFECDVDIGSSTVANGIVRFVLGYVKSIVVDMAFLIQANSEAELPEQLLGTVRISQLDPAAAVQVDPRVTGDPRKTK